MEIQKDINTSEYLINTLRLLVLLLFLLCDIGYNFLVVLPLKLDSLSFGFLNDLSMRNGGMVLNLPANSKLLGEIVHRLEVFNTNRDHQVFGGVDQFQTFLPRRRICSIRVLLLHNNRVGKPRE